MRRFLTGAVLVVVLAVPARAQNTQAQADQKYAEATLLGYQVSEAIGATNDWAVDTWAAFFAHGPWEGGRAEDECRSDLENAGSCLDSASFLEEQGDQLWMEGNAWYDEGDWTAAVTKYQAAIGKYTDADSWRVQAEYFLLSAEDWLENY